MQINRAHRLCHTKIRIVECDIYVRCCLSYIYRWTVSCQFKIYFILILYSSSQKEIANIIMSLVDLPVYLIHHIFDYLGQQGIVMSVMNVCNRLNNITASYYPYQVNREPRLLCKTSFPLIYLSFQYQPSLIHFSNVFFPEHWILTFEQLLIPHESGILDD